MPFFSEADLKGKKVREGITLKSVSVDKTMMTIFEFEPGTVIPVHKHPHEQITYVVEGEIEFALEGEIRLLRAGEGVIVTADREHSARVLDKPSKAVDAWYPIREDYQ
jgi:quercetin dioxygenase-like cupin family protein